MDNTRKKIAVVCRVEDTLEHDDRIRKECISLSKNYEVKIFVTYESNKKETGITSFGVPFQSFALVTRSSFPSGKFLLIKAFEFWLKIRPLIKDYDLLWAHEEYAFLFPLLAPKGRFVWDLHEIPWNFMHRKLLKLLFKYIENKAIMIVHANYERIEYLKSINGITNLKKHCVIHNYPDDYFINSAISPRNIEDFIKWKNGNEYVYLQGLSTFERYPYNTISAILKCSKLKILIVGRFNDLAKQELIKLYGKTILEERVFFMGLVLPVEMPSIIIKSKFSMIFYNTIDPNSRYCEANRFYNAIALGVPVITGCNEPMSNIVNLFNNGISIKSDGNKIEEIEVAICKLLNNYEVIANNSSKVKSEFRWKDRDVLKVLNNIID